jgi:hypothetical protein
VETPFDSTVLGSTTEDTDNVIYYASTSSALGTANYVKFKFSGGRSDEDIRIIYKEECLNTVIDIAFVNKHGAVQHLYCFGDSERNTNTTETRFKRNIRSEGTYDTKKHQYAILEKNGKNTITVNTGFYPESANQTFQELMHSHKCWMEVPVQWLGGSAFLTSTQTAPVRLTNTSLRYKTQLKEKLINYTFTFEFAFDNINNVR